MVMPSDNALRSSAHPTRAGTWEREKFQSVQRQYLLLSCQQLLPAEAAEHFLSSLALSPARHPSP